MLTPAEATAAIAAHIPRMPTIPVALRDASGCVLKQTVVAERDQPPFDRVAMDGVAIASGFSTRQFRIAGTQAAGTAPLSLPDPSSCIEVMTGAMLPAGCDCVIPVERISVKDGIALLAEDVVTTRWLNLHRRASDCAKGATLLNPGARLSAPEIAITASAGLRHVKVARPPRIVIVSTGNELVEPGAPIMEWQIRRSNVYGVMTSLRSHGFSLLHDDHIPDDEKVLRHRLDKHLEEADVLILSGGVSMGKFDFVPQILGELKVRQIFHKIAQRPGKPMWFGVREATAVFGLPGNPVSTLACLARYVLPGLRVALGLSAEPESFRLDQGAATLPALATLLPVRVVADAAGTRCVRPQPTQGSGDFTSLVSADGCVELPPASAPAAANTVVKFYRW